ncbi:hypothetical protein [Mammaliicoccus vitulinus]|uniref:hypothetical protein n=1 Tax=Mammaliicoccus vitulinus TaxID=71237 RepID=UPI00248BB783|nr:hypothetical protein [Mammaliicoccus vitulinus]
MNEQQYKKEEKEAFEFFDGWITEINVEELYVGNIKTLLNYLHDNSFEFKDVKQFYYRSDMQDEFDILRLMEYLDVLERPQCITSRYEILKINEDRYLVIDDGENSDFINSFLI